MLGGLLDQSYDALDYTFESYQTYQTVYNLARQYFDLGQFTAQGIRDHRNALRTAIDLLVPITSQNHEPADKTELLDFLNLLDGILDGRVDDYTIESAQSVNRDRLVNLHNNPNSTRNQIDTALAEERAKLQINKDKYRQMLDDILSSLDLDSNVYTNSTIQDVNNIIDSLDDLLVNGNPTFEQLQSILNDLNQSISALQRVPNANKGVDPLVVGIAIACVVLAMGLLMCVLVTRKKRHKEAE